MSGRSRLFLKNARQIVKVGGGSGPKLRTDMNQVEVFEDQSMLVDGAGKIARFVKAGAETEALQKSLERGAGIDRVVDCKGKCILPGFVDCHTHAVFDGDRSHEHALKMAGASYEEVHAAGGGINFTVRATQEASSKHLLTLLLKRLDDMMQYGTTTCEIKSGYGLDWASEVKMLHTVQQARGLHRMGTSLTFLAHAIPKGDSSSRMTQDMIQNWLPKLKMLMATGELSVDSIDVSSLRLRSSLQHASYYIL
jgi:imidazolonepropionase